MNHDASVYTIDITVWKDLSQAFLFLLFLFLFHCCLHALIISDKRLFRRMKKDTERDREKKGKLQRGKRKEEES